MERLLQSSHPKEANYISAVGVVLSLRIDSRGAIPSAAPSYFVVVYRQWRDEGAPACAVSGPLESWGERGHVHRLARG